jgi:hypothetical protein
VVDLVAYGCEMLAVLRQVDGSSMLDLKVSILNRSQLSLSLGSISDAQAHPNAQNEHGSSIMG